MAAIDEKKVRLKTGKEITIRSARPEDAAALLTYIHQVLIEPGYFIIEPQEFTLTESEESAWIQDHLEEPGRLVLVAVADGAIVGVLNFENGERKRAAHSGTLHLSLAQNFREQGLGTAILSTLVDWARANPLLERLQLSVFHDNERAQGLYRKLGFIEEGVRRRAFKTGSGEYIDEVLMARFVES